eukprot:2373049-Pleurochrysis_carterae.AAC.6
MAPAGDTLTSRRVFDAMSAGCLPVVMRSTFLMNKRNWDFETGARTLPAQSQAQAKNAQPTQIAALNADASLLVGTVPIASFAMALRRIVS